VKRLRFVAIAACDRIWPGTLRLRVSRSQRRHRLHRKLIVGVAAAAATQNNVLIAGVAGLVASATCGQN